MLMEMPIYVISLSLVFFESAQTNRILQIINSRQGEAGRPQFVIILRCSNGYKKHKQAVSLQVIYDFWNYYRMARCILLMDSDSRALILWLILCFEYSTNIYKLSQYIQKPGNSKPNSVCILYILLWIKIRTAKFCSSGQHTLNCFLESH